MRKEILILCIAGIMVFSTLAFLFVSHSYFQTPKVKPVNCSQTPDVYFLKPSESSSIQPILHKDKMAIVVIPETHEVRANTELLKCPGIDFQKYVWGGNE